MIRFALFAVATILFGLSSVNAGEPRTLNWDMLLPKLPEFASPFLDLPEDQQIDIELLADIRWMEVNGGITKGGPMDEERIDLTRQLTEQDVDIEASLRDYENLRIEASKRNRAIVPELSGATVRMPGYALPLEYEGESVTEFLLVPYVGACIHAPPPPPNQMVYVKVNQSFVIKDLFEAVWVTGRLEAKTTSKKLSFIDGQAAVEAGYVMEGTNIEYYEADRLR